MKKYLGLFFDGGEIIDRQEVNAENALEASKKFREKWDYVKKHNEVVTGSQMIRVYEFKNMVTGS